MEKMTLSNSFEVSQLHKSKVNAMKYAGVADNEHLSQVMLTASEDRTVKLWDRRNGSVIHELKYNNLPFFSVDTNKQTICAGTNSEVVFWDLRKMRVLTTYQDAHADDITALRFHPTNPDWLISCATDNMLCHFSFTGKASLREDDTLEGVYASEQPLIDCGYIGNDLLWVQTSINTVEVLTV